MTQRDQQYGTKGRSAQQWAPSASTATSSFVRPWFTETITQGLDSPAYYCLSACTPSHHLPTDLHESAGLESSPIF